MAIGDVEAVSGQLAEQSAFREETIQAWVFLALKEADPAEWTDALAARALDRLALAPATLPVKAEAKRQIIDIRRSIHAGIAKHRQRVPVGRSLPRPTE